MEVQLDATLKLSGESTTFMIILLFVPEKDITCFLMLCATNITIRNRPFREQSRPCILGTQVRMFGDPQGLW